MKFAVVTDIHIGAYHQYKQIYRKTTLYSKTSLEKFAAKMNSAYKPEFVVNCGDIVEDIDPVSDERNLLDGIELLSRLDCPVYHVIGNCPY
jgi:metallophosphoesterase superfamily enzyme